MANILIADDDQLVIDLITYRLQRKGHTVHSATEGEQVMQCIQDSAPDLIVIDYQLPVVDSPEIIAALKANPQTSRIPIIMLAAQWQEQDTLEALGSGITDTMTKPFSPDELIFRIERALGPRPS